MAFVLVLVLVVTVIASEVRVKSAQKQAHQAQSDLVAALESREKDLTDRGKRAARSARGSFDGHIAEHSFPYQEGHGYHPKDVFHVGGAVDYIVFDGLFGIRDGSKSPDDLSVILVDVKYGSGAPTPEQRAIISAMNAGRTRGECWVARQGDDRLAFRQRNPGVPMQSVRKLPEGS